MMRCVCDFFITIFTQLSTLQSIQYISTQTTTKQQRKKKSAASSTQSLRTYLYLSYDGIVGPSIIYTTKKRQRDDKIMLACLLLASSAVSPHTTNSPFSPLILSSTHQQHTLWVSSKKRIHTTPPTHSIFKRTADPLESLFKIEKRKTRDWTTPSVKHTYLRT